MASLLVALTLTPALCYWLLGEKEIPTNEPRWVQRLKTRYLNVLETTQSHSKGLMMTAAGMTLAGLIVLAFMRTGFLPDLKEGHFIAHSALMPGTSLKETLRFGTRISDELLKLPYVRYCAQRIGRAEMAEDTWGTNYSEFDIDLKPLNAHETELADAAIRKVFDQYPFASTSIMSYLSEHIMDTISGHQAAVVINVFGNNLDVLDQKATEITRVLNSLPDAKEVQFRTVPSNPQVTIKLRDDALLRWGFDAVDVLEAIRAAYQGTVVTQIAEGNQSFGVSVILDPEARQNVLEIGELPLRNASGLFVPLKQLADIQETTGRHEVTHEGGRRVQTVTTNVASHDIQGFIHRAQNATRQKVTLPAGTYLQIEGTGEAQKQSTQELVMYSLLSGLGIILLLSLIMKSWQNLLLVLANIPFALVGGIVAVLLMGGVLTLGAMVGFITLFGITLRNSIMLISHYEHLVVSEGRSWTIQTAWEGASERLVPILMTALVTALGLLPLALGSGAPGREIEGPLASVILGGLTTSTLLNLLILPTLAARFCRFTSR
jgi:Cu/Ag efflux pump CusA